MNHFNLTVRLAHIAATIAATIIAIGATYGFYEMHGHLTKALLSGIGIASVLALGWWILITAASRVRRISSRILTAVLGFVLVLIAVGTSGWALATAIGGSSVLNAHYAAAIDEHEIALNAAHARAQGQEGILDALMTASTAYAGYVEAERNGDMGNGSGCGPNCRAYQRASDTISSVRSSLTTELEVAEEQYAYGLTLLAEAAAADNPAPKLAQVAAIVVALNAVDLDAGQIGMINFTADAVGVTSATNDRLTQAIVDADKDLSPAPATPSFEEITAAEAMVRYPERAVGAWIAAVSVDVAPFLMLLMVMLLTGEPLLRETRAQRQRVSDAEIREREDEVENSTVTPMFRRTPAE